MGKSALIVVDIQNDFLPNGSMGIAPAADKIIPLINSLVKLPFDVCVASGDFHPPHHCSFASTWEKKPGECILIDGVEQTLWPDHCVQGTFGVEFSSKLDTSHFEHIAHKGVDPKVDSYSIFFDSQKHRSTGLDDFFKSKGITDLYFAGICTEYCVFYSVIDAIQLGYKTHVVIDACYGIDLQPGNVQRAISKMVEKGSELVTTEQVQKTDKITGSKKI